MPLKSRLLATAFSAVISITNVFATAPALAQTPASVATTAGQFATQFIADHITGFNDTRVKPAK